MYSGDVSALLDDHYPLCATAASGADALLQYTATVDGTHRFDTVGSAIDTVLFALSACGGPEVACNDDLDPSVFGPSAFEVELAAGEQIILGVEGYGGAVGPFVVNVTVL